MNNTILVPRNIEGRKEKLRQHNIKLLSQEIIYGNLDINESFENISEELVKVKKIYGNVNIVYYSDVIPIWLKNIKVYGIFNCSLLYSLYTLKNCPQYVSNDFYCSFNNLTSLEGCPKYIGGNLYCRHNIKILELPEGVELKGELYND